MSKGFDLFELLEEDLDEKHTISKTVEQPENTGYLNTYEITEKTDYLDEPEESQGSLTYAEKGQEDPIYMIDMESGYKYLVKKETVLIGCQAECDIVIQESTACHTISRKHAYLTSKNGKIYIKDISSNGTYKITGEGPNLKAVRLKKGEEEEILPNQIVKFAAKAFKITRG